LPCWPWTMILLISAFPVARMSGVSHWHLTSSLVFKNTYFQYYSLRNFFLWPLLKEVIQNLINDLERRTWFEDLQTTVCLHSLEQKMHCLGPLNPQNE
jgi:hypothetical protein